MWSNSIQHDNDSLVAENDFLIDIIDHKLISPQHMNEGQLPQDF
jgi:hypothetical protein